MAPDEAAGGYEHFRVRISRSGADRYSVRATCRGAATSGAFELPFSSEGLELLILKTQARRGTTRTASRSEGVAAAQEIGERLYAALFQGHVGAFLWKESDAVAGGLRITLELSDAPELMDLPWEYLYEPDKGHFLAVSRNTPIVRYLDVPSMQRPLVVDLPLRMLAMISSPTEVAQLNTDHEKNLLNDALCDLISSKLVEVDWLENGTRGGLREKLRGRPYHVFHYIGHGNFEQAQGEGFLLFEDADKRSDPIHGRDLGQMLYEHTSLRLAVLNACEGARASNARNEPFAGVAARLVRNQIPAVIAMQFEITDSAAARFSHSFYGAIADGEPVDSALAYARQDLSDADPGGVEWGTPVLFMRVDDGRIFDVADKPAEPLTTDADSEPAITTTPPVGEKGRGRLRRRHVLLAAGFLVIALSAFGIAQVLPGGKKQPRPEPSAARAIAGLPSSMENSSQPTWEPGGTMIAFTVADADATTVYVANLQGLSSNEGPRASGTTVLASNSMWPSWATTGKIAYQTNLRIWVTDQQLGDPTQLAHDKQSDYPAWSPDGSQVVFSTVREGHYDLFTIDTSPNATAVPLTRDSPGSRTDDVSPAWSPDGTRIAFIRRKPDDCARGDLWVVNADGSQAPRPIALPGGGDERRPTWSPNGKEIAFSSDITARGNYDLYTVDADGSHLVRRTRTAADDVGPSWGADGIAFARGTYDCAGGSSQQLSFLPLRD